ncbi:hypothetical protein DE146DRAFT_330595 [Phaeosphaeria sp. MPI-PUGE-AT-0046c]|nr:hypothetical protein DE146DRAFT_330595 [Phaeosphaeria sp. MPI-PUGE-AT-0046c]
MMLSPGAIAGIVVGSVVGLIIFVIVPCYLLRRRRASAGHQSSLIYPVGTVPPELAPGDAISLGSIHHAPTLFSGQRPSDNLVEYGYDPVYGDTPVNFGSMQVKGIRDVRGDRERNIY